MSKHSWKIGVGLASMLLGMLLVFQFRTETNIKTYLPQFTTASELGIKWNRLQTDLNKKEEELKQLRQQLQEYNRDEELKSLRMAAGVTPLRGPGVEITLTDVQRPLKSYEDPNLFIVHYDQLELLVNELWAAGAEAIAVNGVRLVAQTGFSCAGTTILVGTRKLAPPYIIRAIGDAATLKAALTIPGGFIDSQIRPFELGIKIEIKDSLYLPPYKGSSVFNYAEVVPEETEETTVADGVEEAETEDAVEDWEGTGEGEVL
ncbi:DUF881 domain-containing protein [Capillibacterium thermochitinicola]|uniref:DUF881 domain-containing protein n=1 Tax=Capillibacterium thermochitinicola TaxID=2699427 RepID=A0A8J6LHD2_9FIRM|nr:DUF881 domain-containing protein [Capillibacterium thermochitinicola]MBA2131960.1 DUF881 domain-containing protein [Capillibacterium thermochitinicola]